MGRQVEAGENEKSVTYIREKSFSSMETKKTEWEVKSQRPSLNVQDSQKLCCKEKERKKKDRFITRGDYGYGRILIYF